MTCDLSAAVSGATIRITRTDGRTHRCATTCVNANRIAIAAREVNGSGVAR